MADPVPDDFTAPVHRAQVEPILLAGVAVWIVGHALGVLAARRDPEFMEVARRHLRLPALLDV